MKRGFVSLSMLLSLLLAWTQSACVTVHDHIVQRDRAKGSPEVTEQEVLNRRPVVDVSVSGDVIVVKLDKEIDCRKKYLQKYTRSETLEKRDTPLLFWLMLGSEFGLSAVTGSLGSIQIIEAGLSNPSLAIIGLLNITLGLGLCSAAVLNSLYYRGSGMKHKPSELQDSYWGSEELCDKIPAADVEMNIQIGQIQKSGRSDAQGIWRLQGLKGTDLGAALLASHGQVRLIIPAAQYDKNHIVKVPLQKQQSLLKQTEPTSRPRDQGRGQNLPPVPAAIPEGASLNTPSEL